MAEDFALNIVCEAPPAAPITGVIKKRKKNKYEKRRERSRKAKLGDVAVKRNGGENHTLRVSTTVATPVGAAPSEELTGPGQGEPQDDNNTEEPELALEATTSDDTHLQSLSGEQTPAVESVQLLPESTDLALSNSATTPLVSSSLPQSRKRHDLANDEERAKYMAEFHARPLEIDRRSGASGRCTESRNSQHLFQADTQLPLHPRLLLQCQTKFNMKKPTQIQIETWRQFHANHQEHNLFVQSETGSGKTLAYLLPIIQSLVVDRNQDDNLIQKDRGSGGTVCLIICPTRELATQTLQFIDPLTRGTWLVGGCLSGGEKRKSEKARLRKGISILVSTPGRLLDHLQKTEALLLSLKGKLQYLVLDESDRLLDMGLGDQIEQIVQRIRANQPGSGRNGITWRSVLVSATVSSKEEQLAKTLMGGDEWVWARGGGSGKQQDLLVESTPRQLSQLHITVTAKLRLATLVAFLVQRVKKRERTVIFMSTCDGVDYHEALFKAMDSVLPAKNESEAATGGIFGDECPIFKLHGNVQHSDRQNILSKFNNCKTSLLLATDVAARGLNLSKVDWIVQYDPPCEVADYAHRAGRAARAGQAGHALLFLLPSERQFLDVLELKGVKHMEALSVAHTLNKAAEICQDLTAESKAGFKNKGEAFSSEVQRRLEDTVAQDDLDTKANYKPPARKKGVPRPAEPCGRLLELARQAFFSYVRAYPTKEKCVRHIFSSRSLHVGHIARSFALKEPPKSSISKVTQTNNDKDKDEDGGKRSAAMAFHNLLDEVQDVVEKKRQRKAVPTNKSSLIKSDGTVDTAKARIMLMERAAKLQQGGMSSF